MTTTSTEYQGLWPVWLTLWILLVLSTKACGQCLTDPMNVLSTKVCGLCLTNTKDTTSTEYQGLWSMIDWHCEHY